MMLTDTGTTPTTLGAGRAGAAALATAGLLFLAYPLLRPWTDDPVTATGAAAFASAWWPVAHYAGVLGFVLLPVGLLATRNLIGGRLTTWALGATWLGVGLVLPYYGAEAFGLHAIGQRVLATGDLAAMALVGAVRNGGLQITTFGIGLVLLAAGPVLAAVAVWRSGVLPRWSAVPFAVGFALYLPQFYG
ncbi:MAG: hypothetical protein L0H84_23900, partial [Pseudonocardia sp.]|nr:hypothetical protein [Pseudonocardia sp.]